MHAVGFCELSSFLNSAAECLILKTLTVSGSHGQKVVLNSHKDPDNLQCLQGKMIWCALSGQVSFPVYRRSW